MDIQNSYRKIIEIMKNILEEISARTRERIAKEKTCISVSELENRIQEVNKNARQKITFLQALQKDGMSYICEVKKASPSKGLIAPDFPYLAIANEYEQAGASAISCLRTFLFPVSRPVSERNLSRCTDTCTPQGFYSR